MGALKRPPHHTKNLVGQGVASVAEITPRPCLTYLSPPPIGGRGRCGRGDGAGAARTEQVGQPNALEELAKRVARLSPSHRNPHAFHEDKSEIVAELRRLARGSKRG